MVHFADNFISIEELAERVKIGTERVFTSRLHTDRKLRKLSKDCIYVLCLLPKSLWHSMYVNFGGWVIFVVFLTVRKFWELFELVASRSREDSGL